MSNHRFDLEKAIAAWRRPFEHNRAFSSEDLEELEGSLRDRIEALVEKGLSEEDAFRDALRRMGSYGTAETEYRKVYWEKLHRRRQIGSELIWRFSMLTNYLKIAWRNMLREKGYAFINVFSLAVGIAFCTLIFLYVRDELTYDQFHTQGDRIFRVEEVMYLPDGSTRGGQSSLPIILGPTLQAEVPGIERYIRTVNENYYVRIPGASTEAIEENVLFADPDILEVFTFPLRQGHPATALSDPGNVVLTESVAQRHFGDANPIGQILQIRLDQKFEDFVVTGVTADVPGNSTVKFGLILNFSRLFQFNEAFQNNAESWNFYRPKTFVTLMENTTEQQVEATLPALYAKYRVEDIARWREEGRIDPDNLPTFTLNPLREIHLTSNSSPIYSYILSGIALAVLLIACINFMMLAMGRSAWRTREVGMRKVLGAQRKQIMAQFWGEAFLLSAFALLAGLLLTAAFLPIFNNLTGKNLEMGMLANGTMAAILIALVVVTGLVAGSYPALVLSRFQPITTLTNRLRLGKPSRFARVLVVLQFAFTVFLIASTVIMTRQLAYTRTMDLGFDKEQVVLIPTSGLDGGKIAERFRTEMERHPSVVAVTASGNMLGRSGSMGIWLEHEDKQYQISVFRVDTHYLDFLGLELVAGRNFNPNLSTDSARAIIVNETLVREFGFDDPIGQALPLPWGSPDEWPVIVGVVKDFHFQSLYEKMGSVMLTLDPEWKFENLLVRIRPQDIPQTLDLLQTTWQAVAPDVPFTYRFLDDQMQTFYANDQRWSEIIRYSALFSVFLACLGLLGLAALSVTRRTKEIGIRKVLGATVSHIVMLISKEFAPLVVLGVILASPVAYLAMERWLESFAYRVPLSGWIFLAVGFIALALALITVGYHAVKSAMNDPVKSLRYE